MNLDHDRPANVAWWAVQWAVTLGLHAYKTDYLILGHVYSAGGVLVAGLGFRV